MCVVVTAMTESSFHDRHKFLSYCPVYDEVLPNGFCSEFFNTKRIALSSTKLKKIDKDYWFYEKIFNFYKDVALENFNDKMQYFAGLYLDECPLNETALDDYKQKIPYISTNSILKCMKQSKWLVCHLYQPVCIKNNVTNKHEYSPMCQESCLHHLYSNACRESHQFFETLFTMSTVCPASFQDTDRFNCSFYPKYDSKDLCQFDKEANTMGNQQKRNDETNQLRTSEIILITSLCISGTILLIAIIAFILIRFKHWHQQNVESGETVEPYCAIHVANIKLIEPTEIDCKLNIKEEDAK